MQYTLLSSYIQLLLEINLKHRTDKSKKLYGISHNLKQDKCFIKRFYYDYQSEIG